MYLFIEHFKYNMFEASRTKISKLLVPTCKLTFNF